MKVTTVERVIPAPAQAIFDVLADPAMHPVIDGSGTLRAAHSGRSRLVMGSEFGMRMHLGVGYRLTNRVVEFDDGRLIAWCHIGGARWRYQLEPVGDTTRVIETFDLTSTTVPLLAFALEALGFPGRNRVGMERTLDRLAEVVASRPVTT